MLIVIIIIMLNWSIRFAVAVQKRARLGRPGTSLKMGLLGMANIGKSSTFNFLSNLNVPAENIPFCTIDPNNAFISVQDKRFQELVKLYKPHKITGPVLRIVDIAGLVKGASQGFGLGNQFLSHVMQVDGLFHVVRNFQGEHIAHTEGGMDAVRDIGIIRHQLIKKDYDYMQKRVKQMGRKASKSQDKNLKEQYNVLLKAQALLKGQQQIRNTPWTDRQIEYLNRYQLLTAKPMVYLINLSKKDYLQGKIPDKQKIIEAVTFNGKYSAKTIPFSVQHQKSVAKGQPSEVQNIIRAAYEQLQIAHYYTVGTDEVRAWAIRVGQTAQQAAGKIHSDLQKGFINAQVIHADVLLKNPQYKTKLNKYSKKQGKTYIIKDGDIAHFNSKIK